MTDAPITIENPAGAAPASPSPAPVDVTQAGASGATPTPAPSLDAADWRAPMVPQDEKDGRTLKELQRYNTPADLVKSLIETKTALSKRDEGMIKLLGADATDDDKKAFNAKLGIPEKPDAYKITAAVPDGLDVSDADRDFLKGVTSKLHQRGGFLATPEGVNAAHEFYYGMMEEQAAQMAAAAEMTRIENERNLKTEWGPEFAVNIKYAEAGVQSFFKVDDASEILDKTFADGTKVGNWAPFLKAMAAAARASGDDPVFLQSMLGGDNLSSDALDDEISKIQGYRQANPSKYAELSAPGGRLMQLMERQQRAKSRA